MVDYNQYRENDSQAGGSDSEEAAGRNKSRLWMGCCGGCALILLIFIGIIAAGMYLLYRSRPVVPPEAFFQPDADGFCVVQVDPEDEGLSALLKSIAEKPPEALDLSDEERRMLREDADEVPERLEKWSPLNLVSLLYHLEEPEEAAPQGESFPGINDHMPPPVKKWLDTRSDKRRFDKALAASLHRGGGLMRLMVTMAVRGIEEEGGKMEKYRNIQIGESADGLAIAAVDNNFMLAERTEIIQGWIDALEDTDSDELDGYSGPPHLENMYRRLQLPALFYFAVSNGQGEVISLLESFREMYEKEGETSSDMQRIIQGLDLFTAELNALGGTFRIESPERAELDLYAECDSEQYARDIGEGMVNMLQQLQQYEITVEGEVDGKVAHVRFVHHDFETFLRLLIESAQ